MKSEKRKELKKLRNSLENTEYLSEKIAKTFLETDIYKNAEVLLLYCSVSSEVSTDEIFHQALLAQKRVAFPVCVDSNGYMEFYFVKDETDLAEGMYGIKSPKTACERYAYCENAVCIVPGLAFDKNGYRLGYGKGYYDRFLEKFKGISVGLCFDEMLADTLPTDDFDKKVDYLITDKKIYKFN